MPKILIVDDSTTFRDMLQERLMAQGYQVETAGSGQEGLEQATIHPDLAAIVADFNMPGMDGLTMCEQIRALPTMERVVMIMCTTESSLELKTRAKAIKVAAWVIKPMIPERFIATLELLLKRAAAA